jgi:hypothetical protein
LLQEIRAVRNEREARASRTQTLSH